MATLLVLLCARPTVQESGRALAFLFLRLSHGASGMCAVCRDQSLPSRAHAAFLPGERARVSAAGEPLPSAALLLLRGGRSKPGCGRPSWAKAERANTLVLARRFPTARGQMQGPRLTCGLRWGVRGGDKHPPPHRLGLRRPASPGALLALLALAERFGRVCLGLACDTCPCALATAPIFLVGVVVCILW